jgi:hypothetical protein
MLFDSAFCRKIYGDAALGESNLRMIEIARQVNDSNFV